MTIKASLILTVVLLSVAYCQRNIRFLQRDPFCADPWSQQTQECSTCICRYYFDESRVCRKVDDLCQSWDINTGKCTSCYRGYKLLEGGCTVIQGEYNQADHPQQIIINKNCLTDDGSGKCLSCRPYYKLHCNDCQTTGVNPFCSNYDNKRCNECQLGYQLDVNNVCQVSEETQPSCSQFQNCQECNGTECTTCQQNYLQEYYSRDCVLPSEQNCAEGCSMCSHNQCFSCAQGYSAQSWPICIACSYMYGRNSQGKCKAIQRDCSIYGNCSFCVLGECLNCQQGSTLNGQGVCS